ncbi:hypothetical protein QZH41_006025 [Actinostola sp. cb2023]|nr:hypothetical protein QZH41_006025 [Actinostola sp. cb2023]
MRVYGRIEHCIKKNKNTKKAMIWPKKMLPALEKMLMNKLNGGSDNGYDNYDNPSTNQVDSNDFADNWDNNKPSRHPKHNRFNGMEMVPLLKMLQEKVGDSSPYDSNGFTGTPSNQGGSKFLTKLLLSQALGKPDRGSVMKDMMQEFFLANGNDRSGEEAREAFSELLGHNNLIRTNSEMEAENTDVNMGPSPGGTDSQMNRMNMPADSVQSFSQQGGLQGGGGQRFQGFGGGVVQAQELPNGRIAPINQQVMGANAMQQMMSQTVNPTTRMLSNENVPNIPQSDQFMESVLPTRVATMHDSQSRPIGFSRNDGLIFEEEGENAARGIKPPPYATGNPYDAVNMMNIGANYQSAAVTDQGVGAADPGAMGMQGDRYGGEIASLVPGYPSAAQQVLASRRNDLPKKHKLHKTNGKTPMRLKDLPKPHDMKCENKRTLVV